MSVVNLKNMTFCYEGSADNVFENVSLSFDTDWKLGLVGRNGRGKTTLLRILAGELVPSGKVEKSVNFVYFPFAVKNAELTVWEVISGIDPLLEEWKVRRELNLLSVREGTLERVFSTLSKGEQTKALLAALFCRENVFLLIDEPTNHLDAAGREQLGAYLKRKSSFIVVSHDRTFLDGCIDHVLSIGRDRITVESGNYSSFLQNKQLRDEFELAQNARLKTEIKRLEEASKRIGEWSDQAEKEKYGGKCDRGFLGAKAARIMSLSKNAERRSEKAIEEKTKLLKDIDRGDALKASDSAYRSERLIGVKDLTISFGGRSVVSELNFEVLRGERVCLAGKNGCGKTSVMRAVLGKLKPDGGELSMGRDLKISYVSQDTSSVAGSLSAFCERERVSRTVLFTVLYQLGVESGQFETDAENLSEGQKKKLLIAKSLSEPSHLYIWDEPLNYVDIITREQIKNVILSRGLSMLFTEHDRYFRDCVATKVIEL